MYKSLYSLKKKKKNVSPMPKTLKLGSLLGRQLSVLYLYFQRYSIIIFFYCHIFPHGDVIGNFLSCFCHGFLSFFPVSFLQTTRLTFPGDLLQNVNFLLMDIGFILFPTPVSALVRSQFVCDSWWSQAPSDE